MGGDIMDISEFIRKSINENEEEAKRYILEQKAKSMEKRFRNNGLPLLFRNKTFDNYDQKNNPNGYIKCKEFATNFPNTKGLLLSGNVGQGKTHLAAAIVNHLNDRMYSTYFGNVIDLISFVKSTYNKNSTLSEMEAISIMTKKVDLLIIDDLGKENNNEYTISLLYQIINKIYENKKPVIITTNYNAYDLGNRLGERGEAMVSRLCGMCEPVIFKGEDWRVKYGIF
jgi:DNA replication protein DnaC